MCLMHKGCFHNVAAFVQVFLKSSCQGPSSRHEAQARAHQAMIRWLSQMALDYLQL